MIFSLHSKVNGKFKKRDSILSVLSGSFLSNSFFFDIFEISPSGGDLSSEVIEEVEFVSSGLGGGEVLVFTGGAVSGGFIPKSLVSVSLGGGGSNNTSLFNDGSVEVSKGGFEFTLVVF